jgi:hypothetical protein
MAETAAALHTPTHPIEVSTYMHPALRAGLGMVGLFIIVIVTHDFGRALWPFSLLTPFFGGLWLIAVGIGSTLIYGVIWGPNERWIISAGQLTIVHELRKFKRSRNYPCTVFVKSMIEAESWDSKPDTYRLCLIFTDGHRLTSPSFTLEADAEIALKTLINY